MLGRMVTSVNLGTSIQTGEVDDRAITTDKLENDAVTADKIADDAVGSEHIEDLSADLTFENAVNIVVNATTGTKIGTAIGQKIGFFNATPVVQANHIADPDQTGGGSADVANNATAINAILVVLENLGFTASS